MDYEQIIREIGTTVIFAVSYPNYYEVMVRKEFLKIVGKKILPKGTKAIISKMVEEMRQIERQQERKECEWRLVARFLGRMPESKDDYAQGLLLIEENRNMEDEKRRRDQIIKDAFLHRLLSDCHYRKSSSTWAGGDHDVYIEIGEAVDCGGDSIRRFSSNRKWSGNDSFHSFTVRDTWVEEVEKNGIGVVDGKITLDAHLLSSGEGWGLYSASWAEQGRGFILNKKEGIILLIKGTAKHYSSERSAKKALKLFLKQEESEKRAARLFSIETEDYIWEHWDEEKDEYRFVERKVEVSDDFPF